jgi:hypothetical protein
MPAAVRDGFVSGAVMFDVLHHLERPIEFLIEASRVLKSARSACDRLAEPAECRAFAAPSGAGAAIAPRQNIGPRQTDQNETRISLPSWGALQLIGLDNPADLVVVRQWDESCNHESERTSAGTPSGLLVGSAN